MHGEIVVGRDRFLGRRMRRKTGSSGFTLLEAMLTMIVLMVAFVAFSRSLGSAMTLNKVNRESAQVQDGLSQMLEILEGSSDFSSLYRNYNVDPDDDLPPGSAPGSGFFVAGLDPVLGDPDGLVGEILFPTIATAAGLELREDVDAPELGMPRDLDGDGGIDFIDHSDDYRLLPVLIRLRWRSGIGERSAELLTILSDR